MDEFEVLEGVAELFGDAVAAGDEVAAEAAAVEDNAAVEGMANSPAIDSVESQGAVRDFIENNPYGSRLWQFSKWLGKTAAGAAAAFAIMYGLNKAAASEAHQTGQRVSLTDYLAKVQQNMIKNGLAWNDEIKQQAATNALAFPWVDCTA